MSKCITLKEVKKQLEEYNCYSLSEASELLKKSYTTVKDGKQKRPELYRAIIRQIYKNCDRDMNSIDKSKMVANISTKLILKEFDLDIDNKKIDLNILDNQIKGK